MCIFFCIGLILRYFVQIHGANDSIDLTVYQRIDPSMTKVMQVMLIMLMQQILTSGQQVWTLDLNDVSTVAPFDTIKNDHNHGNSAILENRTQDS